MYWFWWPITLSAAATFTALHLYYTARSNLSSRRHALTFAFAAVGCVAIVSIPLALAGDTPCSDEGADVVMPNLAVTVPLMIGWLVVLCGLYSMAGADGLLGIVAPVAAVVVTLAGLFLETFIAYLSLDNYCRTGSRNGLNAQLGTAALITVLGGLVVAAMGRSGAQRVGRTS